jgi:GntR family transcriptional regulator
MNAIRKLSPAADAKVVAMSAVPMHAQIREIIRRRVLDGTYAPHSQMPSESQMMEAFSVSRITVRQALGDLQKEGLIFKVAGKGSFVAKPKAFQSLSRLPPRWWRNGCSSSRAPRCSRSSACAT